MLPDWPRRKAVAEFRLCVMHDCLVYIFTAMESATPPTAYAASANPRTETIQHNVSHCLIGKSVSDTGRPGQKRWETDFASFVLQFLWLLLAIRTFTFTLNVVYSSYIIYSVMLIFYFCWSQSAMINNQRTCH